MEAFDLFAAFVDLYAASDNPDPHDQVAPLMALIPPDANRDRIIYDCAHRLAPMVAGYVRGRDDDGDVEVPSVEELARWRAEADEAIAEGEPVPHKPKPRRVGGRPRQGRDTLARMMEYRFSFVGEWKLVADATAEDARWMADNLRHQWDGLDVRIKIWTRLAELAELHGVPRLGDIPPDDLEGVGEPDAA